MRNGCCRTRRTTTLPPAGLQAGVNVVLGVRRKVRRGSDSVAETIGPGRARETKLEPHAAEWRGDQDGGRDRRDGVSGPLKSEGTAEAYLAHEGVTGGGGEGPVKGPGSPRTWRRRPGEERGSR
ncbi:hypothetical protein NDU88_004989 [Pleurodeles waltl]|uniref:Uncharacterized protein n=1 Tax=Pleurodeles waltl TaxID=8319 RepID=A0AAV7RKB0_PLEWA|nr:hypothetical protein NDU88_004989 [Pleurodeles waltl]